MLQCFLLRLQSIFPTLRLQLVGSLRHRFRGLLHILREALELIVRSGQFAAALADSKIAVNSVCTGWVKTDMGGSDAPRSVEEGADTIVWLATEAPQTMTGLFIRDRKPIPW